jgi:hypothetical protein
MKKLMSLSQLREKQRICSSFTRPLLIPTKNSMPTSGSVKTGVSTINQQLLKFRKFLMAVKIQLILTALKRFEVIS